MFANLLVGPMKRQRLPPSNLFNLRMPTLGPWYVSAFRSQFDVRIELESRPRPSSLYDSQNVAISLSGVSLDIPPLSPRMRRLLRVPPGHIKQYLNNMGRVSLLCFRLYNSYSGRAALRQHPKPCSSQSSQLEATMGKRVESR